MSNKIITPTGGRPEAIANLNDYLTRQTFQDFEWIILDDVEPHGHAPSRCDHYIVADWVWNGENTQSKAVARLLQEVIDSDKVLICEDDDWYSPHYVEKMIKALNNADIVGEKNAIYYNVNNYTYRHCGNTKHASLCSTGVTKTGIERLRKSTNNKWIDMELWKSGGQLLSTRDSLGIKGMPGRVGIGVGHDMVATPDPNHEFLKSIIGDDARRYV
ncbi:MAG: glycosyltransferase family 2 protein [Proteobacteria bacterium]|nr:MAG: glycosyltransferase family 2 protein [Pseudomonadota bacterium]